MNNNKSKASNEGSKNNKKNGFTLIELLVVVLIIGILAAIVLPMYQTAVAKAKLSKLVTVTKSLADAEERFYMINGVYGEISSLDIEIPSSDYSCVADSGYGGGYIWAQCWNDDFAFTIYYQHAREDIRNYWNCRARTQDTSSPLANACEQILKNPNSGVSASATCNKLGMDSCILVMNR